MKSRITIFSLVILMSSCGDNGIDKNGNVNAEKSVNQVAIEISQSSETALGLVTIPKLSLAGSVTPSVPSISGADTLIYNLAKNLNLTITVDAQDLAQLIASYLSAPFSTKMGSTPLTSNHGDYFNRYPHKYQSWTGTSTAANVGTTTTLTAHNPCQELQGGISKIPGTNWNFLHELTPTASIWPGGSHMDGTMLAWQNGTLTADFFSCQYSFSQKQTSGYETPLYSMFAQNSIRALCGSSTTKCANSLSLAPLYSGHRNRIWFSWTPTPIGCYWTTYVDGNGVTQNVAQGNICKLPIEYLGAGTSANTRGSNLFNAVTILLNLINARTVQYTGTPQYQLGTSPYVMSMSTLIGQYSNSDFPAKLFVFNPGPNGMQALGGILYSHEHLFEQLNTNLTQQMTYPGTSSQAKTLFQKQAFKDLDGAAPCFFYYGQCGNVTALMPPSSYLNGITSSNLFMILWNPPSNPGTSPAWLVFSSASNPNPDGAMYSPSQTFNPSNTNLFYRIYRDSNGYYIFTDISGQNCLYASSRGNRALSSQPCNGSPAERFR